LKQEIANGQKALEEGAAVLEAILIKHPQDVCTIFVDYLNFKLLIDFLVFS
jgi:hypothetical protein